MSVFKFILFVVDGYKKSKNAILAGLSIKEVKKWIKIWNKINVDKFVDWVWIELLYKSESGKVLN